MALPTVIVGGASFADISGIVTHTNDRRPRTDGLALHHSTSSATFFSDADAEIAHVQALAAYDAQQWGSASYHAYAFPSGAVYVMGDGALQLPAVAYENDHLESICMVGLFTTRDAPFGILGGVANWTLAKWRQHQFMALRGHRDWVNLVLHPTWATECPGDKGAAAIPTILRMVEALARCA